MSVILKKGKEAIFQNRHQWIFSGAISSFPDSFEEGGILPIFSYSKELLGYGYFHTSQSLCGRIVSFGTFDPWKTIYDSLDRAIALRDTLFDGKETNAYRLVNGEGDHLPGLIIDQYDNFLVLQSGTLGMDKMLPKIVEFLIAKKRWKGIFEKSASNSRKEEGLKDVVRVLHGEEVEEIAIVENGLRFPVQWKKGQKTGFFIDQREMRNLVKDVSRNRKVLNCFCYTGGFSVYALAGGARGVDSVDISRPALDVAEKALQWNHQTGSVIEADAFDFLRNSPLDYDLIILDPPAFVKKHKDLQQGIKGYREINSTVLSKMPKDSLLLTCSCSYYMDNDLFRTTLFQAARAAKRNVQILKESSHPLDHPISLFHPESRYLKGYLLRT